jgi:pyruvate/2-oxoglutarate dehydrogenase complex dihydrolipoamide acyltransferase (E2) component
VPIIEVHVQPGAKVEVDDPLVTLESDKATMDIPAPQAGTVGELRVKPGDRVSQGSPILVLEAEGAAAIPPKERIREVPRPPPPGRRATARPAASTRRSMSGSPTSATSRTVPVIEVHVRPGDEVKAEDPLLTLESDKATMDVRRRPRAACRTCG